MLRKEHDFLDITGVPSIWVPDNLKSAVTKACRYYKRKVAIIFSRHDDKLD